MADKLEGDATDGQSRTAKPKPAASVSTRAKPKRKAEHPTITDDLRCGTSKPSAFVRSRTNRCSSAMAGLANSDHNHKSAATRQE